MTWLPEGDSASEPEPEPCDEVDGCARGHHGEDCQSYRLNPYDPENTDMGEE